MTHNFSYEESLEPTSEGKYCTTFRKIGCPTFAPCSSALRWEATQSTSENFTVFSLTHCRRVAHMTQGLIRLQHSGQSHFVTFSCYHRQPKMNAPAVCDLFLRVLEKTRQQFSLRVYGYVIMPEHIHLLLSEPAYG